MFINSISSLTFNVSKSNVVKKQDLSSEKINFKGLDKADIARNQMKILLAQDIWAPKLKVKMPESQLEKEALLDVLAQRLKLDRFVRLRYEKLAIQSKLSEIEDLLQTDPKNPQILALEKDLAKRGNIDAVLLTINKQIEQEEKRNKPAIEYFESLSKTQDEYLEKKLIKYNQLDKTWHQINKNNINKDGKLSTADLIEVIKSGEKSIEEVEKVSPRILSRKDLLNVVENEYEMLMRENINVYATAKENKEINNQYDKSKNIRYQVVSKYADTIKRMPGMEPTLKSIFAKVEKRYAFKVNQLTGVDIYPIGEIWDQMRDVEKSMKTITEELPVLKEKFTKEPNNKTLEMEITGKEIVLAGLRDDWARGAKLSVDYEVINASRMEQAGKLKEYIYLTEKNKTLNLHKETVKTLEENDGKLPEDFWSKVIK